MFSRFFIDRPIFATVLSVVVTLAGAIALFALPVTQYPEIAPPTVEVSTTYAGANSQVVADTVAAPIEQQVNGVEGMMYMSSQSTNDGNYVLNVTFRPGTDLNLAQVLVQNRVALAQPILPDLVKRRGVTVKKKSPSVLMIVNLYSPDGSRDNLYLSNYATIQLRDELSRLPGVGDISFLGQRDYSLRVWIDPQQLAMRNLTTQDVVRAIEQQNIQVAAGQIGQPPAPNGQMFQYAMTTVGRLSDPEEFGNIVLSTDAEGRLVRLRDVAVSELGARVYDQVCTLDGQPSVALSIYQLPGSNALDTANNVRQKMEELRDRFPEGLDYSIVYDTTPFIRESVVDVVKTLRDAIILVAIVVLVFLQNWRATVIPLVAVPVAIVGTFAAMVAVGFSLNTLTLFGLVLAVGIVVDDAIVVVEAVEHHIEHGMAPREAAIRAMDEVAGPVIAVGLVLTAVFIPCAFITGVVGQFFRQFAVTIAISTIISAFNSLTLSPALAVLFLKPRASGHGEALPRVGLMLAFAVGAALFIPQPWQAWLEARLPAAPLELFSMGRLAAGVAGLGVGWAASRVVNYLLLLAFRLFHGAFQLFTDAYVLLVRWSLRLSLVVLAIYGGLLYETYDLFQTTPSGFIPTQDKGYLVVNVQLPDGASLERTEQLMKKMELQAGEVAGVNHTVTLAGQSLLLGSTAPNFGSMYVMLDEFHDRSVDGRSADAIAADLQKMFDATVEGAEVNILGAPPIDGLGTAGGFKIVIEDRTGQGLGALEEASQRIIEEGQERPELKGLFTNFRANTTWLLIDIDRDATQSLGISLADVFHALQVNLGSLYVNDFNRFGRTWQVNVQADSQFRRQADDLKRMFVRTSHGRSVPLSTLARVREVTGPLMLVRYNLYQSAFVNGDAAPGSSSGDALRTLEAIANEQAQPTLRAEWTELAFLQQTAGSTAMFAFVLAVVLVFLVLAAQYESWSLPLAVILVVPLCLLCSIVGVRIAKMDVNIFTQVGFVVLVGLACKNAILIVEFARARHVAGVDRWTATLEACRLRLRPIIMTSLAFIFGVVPLLVGVGAGAEMRRTLGAAVFAGMLGVTVFGIFLTPVFYYVIQTVVDWRTARRGVAAPTKAS